MRLNPPLKEYFQMLIPEFTARNVAKFVAQTIVQQKTVQLTEQALDDYTALDTDSNAVHLGANVFGWFVADKLKPVTDKMVDKTADFVTAKRDIRNAKKNAKKED
jgi:hypothetical protein